MRESVTWRQKNGNLRGQGVKPIQGETADTWLSEKQEHYNNAMIQAYTLENKSDIGLKAYENIITQSAWAV